MAFGRNLERMVDAVNVENLGCGLAGRDREVGRVVPGIAGPGYGTTTAARRGRVSDKGSANPGATQPSS